MLSIRQGTQRLPLINKSLLLPSLYRQNHDLRIHNVGPTLNGPAPPLPAPPASRKAIVLPNPGHNTSSIKATRIPSSFLSYYYDTQPPTSTELHAADRFFHAHPPSLLFSASKFRTVKFTEVPEVAFLGRSNVGKSTLLNALMGQPICHTSRHPGRTKTMNGFAVGGQDGVGNEGRVTVLDMPGYGFGSRDEWGPEIVKYLVGRRELRRAFLLLDPLHGLKETDLQILKLFRHNAIPHQVVLSKVDRILLPKQKSKSISQTQLAKNAEVLRGIVEGIKEKVMPMNDGPPALGEILTCSADNHTWKSLSTEPGGKLGINALRWAVLAATGLNRKGGDIQVEVEDSARIINVTDRGVENTSNAMIAT